MCYLRGGSPGSTRRLINARQRGRHRVRQAKNPAAPAKMAAAVDAAHSRLRHGASASNVDFRPGEGRLIGGGRGDHSLHGLRWPAWACTTDVEILNIMIGKTICS